MAVHTISYVSCVNKIYPSVSLNLSIPSETHGWHIRSSVKICVLFPFVVLSLYYFITHHWCWFIYHGYNLFNCRALCWSICVWNLNKSPKRHLPRGFLFRSIHSPPFLPVFLSYFSFLTLHVTCVVLLLMYIR